MTLLDLIARSPHLFNTAQDWYKGERFANTRNAPPKSGMMPTAFLPCPDAKEATLAGHGLPFAVNLVQLYTEHPGHWIWKKWLWCADTDSQGQRVFVGATDRGMEIHRHLHLTPRFGCAVWEE